MITKNQAATASILKKVSNAFYVAQVPSPGMMLRRNTRTVSSFKQQSRPMGLVAPAMR